LKLSEDFIKDLKGKLLKKDKLIILLLLGMIIFVVAIPVSDKKKNQNNYSPETDEEAAQDKLLSQEEYKEMLENELSEALSQVSGIGRVKVMITLASTSESVIKEDKKTSSSDVTESDSSGGTRTTKEKNGENVTVYSKTDNDQTPYVIKENMPAVSGVLVVAEGGDEAKNVQNISEAVKALFGIEAHKIKVMKMEN